MTKSACDRMKLAAVSAAVFIIIGGSLVFLAQHLSLETLVPPVMIALGFSSIVIGFLVMIATVITVMLPSVSRQLDLCRR